jgi:hypothetical protein
LTIAALAGWYVTQLAAVGIADEPPAAQKKTNVAQTREPADRTAPPVWKTAVDPKPLSANVKKGLAWLAEHQLPNGGWGQGEESAQMRGSSVDRLRDQANVADTCIAALALIRAGNTPIDGLYKDAVARAVRYVVGQIEESDAQSLAVSTVRGTRVQGKLGPNIDTFLASMLLAEVKGKMPAAESERTSLALDKVLDKIKRNQKEDGSFEGGGWAPILAQAMCGKGINRARQAGAQVSGKMLARAQDGAAMAFAAPAAEASAKSAASAGGYGAASFGLRRAAPASAAGVELYDRAANLGVLQDTINTQRAQEPALRRKAVEAKDVKEREEAKNELSRFGESERVYRSAQQSVIARLDDKQFVSGFGSNGGEEFLSYMNISESLVVKGGPEWKQWDDSMTSNLNRIQNDDGTWTGHHCITGRTFCTSSALLVLLADRTPVPVVPEKAAAAVSQK